MVAASWLLRASAAVVSLLVLLGAVALLLLGTAAVIRTVLPDADPAADSSISRAVAWAQSLRPPAASDEERAARQSNVAIRDWSVACGLITYDASTDRIGDAQPTFERIRPIGAVLFEQRIEMARAVDAQFTVLEAATIAGILIGLATTIFAGLRGDDETTGAWKRPVRVLAIVFPALGTAVAAVAAFYGPREQLARSSQALAGLQQLHLAVRTGLARLPCPTDEATTRDLERRLAEWEERLAQQGRETTAARLASIAAASQTVGRSGLN